MNKTYETRKNTAACRQKAAQKFRGSMLDRFLEMSTVPASQYAHVKCSSAPFTAGFFQG